jgi:predicted dehydrogenase
MAETKVIRLAVVGTGGMSRNQAAAFQKIEGVQIVAACDLIPDVVHNFGEQFGVTALYTDSAEMLACEKIDAVTVVTTDDAHAPVALQAIAAGKHVLCEKPLATCYADACRMAEAAKAAGVINMVNLSYRNASAIHKAHQLVQEGALGRILHVEASYLQSWLTANHWGNWRQPQWLWRLSTGHGSRGALGDLGVHLLDFAAYAAGDITSLNCTLKTFPKVEGDRVGDYVLDANDSVVVTAGFEGGALGSIHISRWATGHKNSIRLRVYGERGAITIDLDQSYTSLKICRGEDIDPAVWKTVRCGKTPNNYERFIRSIRTGKNDQPDFERGAKVQKWLDACFESDRQGKTLPV